MSETPSTPGSLAVENLKRQDLVAIFKEPAARKKPKPKILTEEKYIEEISKIIQRDFFPDLHKLRAQNDYLDAMERKDYAQMEVIRAKYSSGRTPRDRSRSMTPATFETPRSDSALHGSTSYEATKCETDVTDVTGTPKSVSSTASEMSSAEEEPQKGLSHKHSLDSFLQKYTSEDNYSFQEIIDAADQKLRQKFAVLYSEEQLSTERQACALTLPSIEQQFDEPDPLRKIETWTYKNMNSIMYIPDGVQLTEEERIEAANRKQTIEHRATRLNINPFDETNSQKTVSEIAKNQFQTLSEKVGVDGNIIGVNTSAAPQIRGFDLVKTPSPRPGEAFSPLMTWGEIEGTPFRLDGSDTPVRSSAGPSFKINESSRRETIALALAEKVGEKMRAQKQRAINTARKNMSSPYMRSNMERLSSMSPAARHLATSKLGLRTPLMTPSPLRTAPKNPMSSKSSVGVRTLRAPKTLATVALASNTTLTPATTPKQISSGKSTLTDDLLKIPSKRLTASDFF